jgi:NADH-quinone oxidoreductase subunit C
MSNISTFDKLSNLTVYSNSKNNNEVFNTNPFSVNVYIIAPRQELRALAAFLKLNSLTRVTNAIDITVVDSINNELRFNINYQLQSSTTNMRWVLSTWVSETKPLLSLQAIYPAFNWTEREVWDMYGVFFVKHPDLRRILTDYGFVGFPLRKDFPLSGFREVQYEDSIKQVEYSSAELTQSYRLLSFTNPWTK